MREDWIAHTPGSIGSFKTATHVLYVAFSDGYTDPKKASADFFKFHRIIAAEHDRGNPRRAKFHKIPMMIGHA